MTRNALSRRTSASAILAAAALLLFLGACAGTKREPVELTDAQLAQDARPRAPLQYRRLARRYQRIVTAETCSGRRDADDSLRPPRRQAQETPGTGGGKEG